MTTLRNFILAGLTFLVFFLTSCDGTLPLEYQVKQLSAGDEHTCAVLKLGGVVCVGSNQFGQLGDPSQLSISTSVANQVPNLTDPGSKLKAVQVVTGRAHTCVLLQEPDATSGSVKCWGSNAYGQLGKSSESEGFSAEPHSIAGLEKGVTLLASGSDHVCALVDGRLVCWGNNQYGQLGRATDENCFGHSCSSKPVEVAQLTPSIIQIVAGENHTCALRRVDETSPDQNEIYCWGSNFYGQLQGSTFQGLSSLDPLILDKKGAIQIAAGSNHTCALKDEVVECWGSNFWHQVDGDKRSDRFGKQKNLGPVVAVSAGGDHTCVLTEQKVDCWGRNLAGEVDIFFDRSSPRSSSENRYKNTVSAVVPGYAHVCLLTNGGEVMCHGSNEAGQLGIKEYSSCIDSYGHRFRCARDFYSVDKPVLLKTPLQM
jgi:alpha-tubulin suppressor-like RCC1 family protein